MTYIISMVVSGFGVFGEAPVGGVAFDEQGLVVVLGQNDDTLSAGSVGSGKTTIFKALSWCLYGRTIDGLTTDVIHKRSTTAEVKTLFERGDVRYRVTRRRTKKTGKLTFEKRIDTGFVDITLGTTKLTQAAIVEKLGMDWDAFRCTVLFGQGDHARFASPTMGDAARKAVLSTVLRLGVYDDARDKMRERVSATRSAIAADDVAIAALNHEIGEIGVEGARWDGNAEIHEAALTTGEASCEDAQAEVDEQNELIASLTIELDELTIELAECDTELAEVEGLCVRARDNARNKTVASREAGLSAAALATEGPCRECGQPRPYDGEAHTNAVAAAQAAKRKQTKADDLHDSVKHAVRVANGDRKTVKGEHSEKKLAITVTERNKAASEAKIVTITKQLEAAEAGIERAVVEIEKLAKQRAKAAKEIVGIDKRVTESRYQLAMAEWWVKGFGPKGVPAYAIEQSLPVLNQNANRHLLTLADGDITVRWTATRVGSSGVEVEELTQNVTIEGVDDVAPSGGQSKKIQLATNLALAELMQDAEDIGMNILLLDEALDGLDREGQKRVIEWLPMLPHESIFVVSHDETIAESFDYRIVVHKHGGSSKITRDV